MKAGLSLVTTTPFTAGSATALSMQAAQSAIEPGPMTFIERPGMSQVTRAIPSPSTS
jgi:hypothetical protein